MKRFDDLTEPEILALAVQNEEEDARIYLDFARKLRANYPDTAAMFTEMAKEEHGHRDELLATFKKRFGDELPYITREDVRGFLKRDPVWLLPDLRPEVARRAAAVMEMQAAAFYDKAAARALDVEVRQLLGHLAIVERGHETLAEKLEAGMPTEAKEAEAQTSRRMFVLQIVQPGLAGLIDGSVSTLAPIFAASFATGRPWDAFLVGLAASIGAGISMGLTEALSDDGEITGRGHPWLRGFVCGLMTTIGGLGHTLPFLIPDFWTANIVAGVVVVIELIAIAWIRTHYMETPFTSAIVQVILGGILVLLTGIFIGSA